MQGEAFLSSLFTDLNQAAFLSRVAASNVGSILCVAHSSQLLAASSPKGVSSQRLTQKCSSWDV